MIDSDIHLSYYIHNILSIESTNINCYKKLTCLFSFISWLVLCVQFFFITFFAKKVNNLHKQLLYYMMCTLYSNIQIKIDR